MRPRRTGNIESDSGGHTLVELLITIVLSLLVLSAIYMSFTGDRKNFFHQMNALRVRQDARVAMNNISQFLRMGTYIFVNQTKTIEGHTYHVAAPGAGGNDLLLASPEGGTGTLTYTVRGYYLRNRVPGDDLNAGAQQLMMYQQESVSPVTPGDPSTIELGALSGGSTRLLADYVPPAAPVFTISTNGKSVLIDLQTEKKLSREMPSQHEELKTAIKLRN